MLLEEYTTLLMSAGGLLVTGLACSSRPVSSLATPLLVGVLNMFGWDWNMKTSSSSSIKLALEPLNLELVVVPLVAVVVV